MRRKIISLTIIGVFFLGAMTLLASCASKNTPALHQTASSVLAEINYGGPRPADQQHVLKLAVDPIPTVRVGFLGTGNRGSKAARRFTFIEDVEIVALCDIYQHKVTSTQKTIADRGFPLADEYVGEEAWKEMCDRDDIDLIYITTDWATHVPMAVYAMERGKHVAIEVPAAISVDESWELVNTAERTQKHCIMLENCTYDFFELTTLNMAQQGLFGDIVHGEGAYIHDLRSQLKSKTNWRIKHYEDYTGNPYPTHGLGPVCQAMNIHRGDKMNFLVSVSTDQFGMTRYLEDTFGKDSPEAAKEYKMGDMNTTIIKTEKGKTIMVQHDVTSPRPYSRLHTLSGTKGFAQKYPNPGISLDSEGHNFLKKDACDKLMKEYEHPFITEIGEYAKEVGGHGGMDFIMDYRLVYCLQNGLPLDMDVYDAAEWSSLFELTEISASNGGVPVKIPDFTRGDWDLLDGLTFAR